MDIRWDVEKDKSRRTVHFIVDGQTVGYYYEDVSDPGVFPIYEYDHVLQDFKFAGVQDSEWEARSTLKLDLALKGWG